MIELPWKEKLTVNKTMLDMHINTMIRRSESGDVFAILLPVSIYEYIKNEGINAELTELPDYSTAPGVIWIKVKKIKAHKDAPLLSDTLSILLKDAKKVTLGGMVIGIK